MAIALPTEEHLMLMETESIATAVGRAWTDPETGQPRTEVDIANSIRTRYNAMRSRLGYNLVFSPDPAAIEPDATPLRDIDVPSGGGGGA
jgi:hypothetical protein